MIGDVVELRVLLRTTTSRDAIVAVAVLERAGIPALACNSVDELIDEMNKGVGAVLVAEEYLRNADLTGLASWLGRQPAWSDLPVLVSARAGVDTRSLGQAFEVLSNVTILERPMRVASVVSAARSALRARERQFQLRAQLLAQEEVDRRKTEFLATLAHELRNPMAPLSATLEILRRQAPLPSGMKPHYDVMQRQITHMAKLVDDLMEVSRITRGKIELKLQQLQISNVIRDAVEISRPAIEAREHSLIVEPVDPKLTVNGDPVRLTQIFSNLLNNAARYTPDGGHIALQARGEGDKLIVSVRDTGVGIAADDLQVVFDMFVQVSGTARAAQGGLGIGLTLVKSLVELHGGHVQAISAGLGLGSEFVVTLPLASDTAASRPGSDAGKNTASSSSDAETLAHLRILVVDDTPEVADSLGEWLQMFGATVEVTYGGAVALDRLAALRPQVAIVDIGMPEMDGYELARRLRKEPSASGLYLIALTGWGQAEDRQRTAAAGFDLHLVKPVDFAELVQRLAAARLR